MNAKVSVICVEIYVFFGGITERYIIDTGNYKNFNEINNVFPSAVEISRMNDNGGLFF